MGAHRLPARFFTNPGQVAGPVRVTDTGSLRSQPAIVAEWGALLYGRLGVDIIDRHNRSEIHNLLKNR